MDRLRNEDRVAAVISLTISNWACKEHHTQHFGAVSEMLWEGGVKWESRLGGWGLGGAGVGAVNFGGVTFTKAVSVPNGVSEDFTDILLL